MFSCATPSGFWPSLEITVPSWAHSSHRQLRVVVGTGRAGLPARAMMAAKEESGTSFLPGGISFNGLKMRLYKSSTTIWCFQSLGCQGSLPALSLWPVVPKASAETVGKQLLLPEQLTVGPQLLHTTPDPPECRPEEWFAWAPGTELESSGGGAGCCHAFTEVLSRMFPVLCPQGRADSGAALASSGFRALNYILQQ